MLLMWSVVMPCLAIVSATAFLNRDAEPRKFVALDSVIVNAEIAREYNKYDGFISARHIKPLDRTRGVATILEGGGGGDRRQWPTYPAWASKVWGDGGDASSEFRRGRPPPDSK